MQREATTGVKTEVACPLCSIVLPSLEDLKLHLPSHVYDKLYRCHKCSYKSDSRSNLIRHLRVHTGERNYPCPVCKYRGGQKSDLKRHLSVHTTKDKTNDRFLCKVCLSASPTFSGIARHILDAHSMTAEDIDEDLLSNDPLNDSSPSQDLKEVTEEMPSRTIVIVAPPELRNPDFINEPTEDPLE